MSSYNELRTQIAELEKKAAEARAQELEGALTQVRNIIREYGFSVADIGKKVFSNGRGARVSGARPPKYVDRATGATWSGFGKRPRWIAAAMKEGRGDDYLIDKSAKAAKPAADKGHRSAPRKAARKGPASQRK